MTGREEVPESVVGAYERAANTGFQLACEAEVGRPLARLSAAVPEGGRILEIGTGVGVGLAWLVHGLGQRRPSLLSVSDRSGANTNRWTRE